LASGTHKERNKKREIFFSAVNGRMVVGSILPGQVGLSQADAGVDLFYEGTISKRLI
jgi:hypothetical protein